MSVRRCLLVLGMALLWGCDAKPSSGPTTTTVTTEASAPSSAHLPELKPRPALRQDVGKTSRDGLAVASRLFVRTLSTEDDVVIGLTFTAQDETLRSAAKELSWSRAFETLTVKLSSPDGNQRTLAAKAASLSRHDPPLLSQAHAHIVRIGNEGIEERRYEWRASWTEPMTALFPGPGRYTLIIAGSVAPQGKTIAFESAPITVDVRAPAALKTVADIEAIATNYVKEHWKLEHVPRSLGPTREDEAGHRVLRYLIGGEAYDDDFIEVIVSQRGEVLSAVSEKIFTCIAAGTAIATPDGPRAVEELAVGDSVIGYDIARGRRVTTSVRAIWRAYSESLFVVSDGLTVSARHPIYADGRWMEAHAVRAGADLLGLDGQLLNAAPRSLSQGAVVYDLSVGRPHTYFAGGVLVHNKAGESPEGRRLRTDPDARPKQK